MHKYYNYKKIKGHTIWKKIQWLIKFLKKKNTFFIILNCAYFISQLYFSFIDLILFRNIPILTKKCEKQSFWYLVGNHFFLFSIIVIFMHHYFITTDTIALLTNFDKISLKIQKMQFFLISRYFVIL